MPSGVAKSEPAVNIAEANERSAPSSAAGVQHVDWELRPAESFPHWWLGDAEVAETRLGQRLLIALAGVTMSLTRSRDHSGTSHRLKLRKAGRSPTT
jgi:hypothetical protein